MSQGSFFDMLLLLAVVTAVALVIWYTYREKKRAVRPDTYLQAMEYLADGNDRLAIQKFKECVREDTENISAYLRLGDLLRRRGLLTNAIRIHKDLTLRGGLPPNRRVEILQSLLRDYDAAQDSENGIQVANEILSLNHKPECWVIETLIRFQEKLEKWEVAGETIGRFQKILPKEFSRRQALYLVFRGLQLIEKGAGKEGRVKFREALKKDRTCVAAHYYLGQSYQDEGRADDAVKAWRRLCHEVPGKAHIVFPALEKAWFELGRFAEAKSLYQELLNHPDDGVTAGLALAEIYHKKGDYDEALAVLEMMKERFGTVTAIVRKQMQVYFSKGQYKQAAASALSYLESSMPGSNGQYQCNQCGQLSVDPQWKCHQCHSLDSFDI